MPPTAIDHARSLRDWRRSSVEPGMTFPSCIRLGPATHSTKRALDQASIAAGLTLSHLVCQAKGVAESREGRGGMIFKLLGPLALLAHRDGKLDLAEINYVALRAYNAAAGKRVNFNDMSKQSGIVPVEGALIPVLLASFDPANPGSAKLVAPDDTQAVLGKGFRLRGRRSRRRRRCGRRRRQPRRRADAAVQRERARRPLDPAGPAPARSGGRRAGLRASAGGCWTT